jgi:sec-independent protein translocase protein TatA
MPTIGVWELVVILVIVVVIFGAGRLSDVGGALGKGIREFRKATTDEHAAAPVVQAAPVSTVQFSGPLPGEPLGASPAVPTVLVENTCPSCATVNPTGQVFCGQCGTRLTLAA